MNERDTERRLRDWLDAQAPSVVPDGLRRAVVAVPTTVPVGWPDRLAAALGPRRAAVPRLAWLLLLAAGLLTALVGGMLVVGSQPVRKLPAVAPTFTCPPGSTPDKPGPVDQARPAGPADQHPAEMAFDRRAGRLVVLADGGIGEAETWTFDVCTNTWTRMHPNREPPSPLNFFGTLVYDVDSDVTVALDDANRMWAYNLEANTWEVTGHAPVDYAPLRFYDPVSGLVVALGDDGDGDTLGLELWSYEVETDTWAPIHQAKPLAIGPHYEDFAYDPSVDRLVAYSVTWEPSGNGDWLFEPRTWLFDIRTGTWSGTGAVTPQFSYGLWGIQPGIAYDEAAGRTVLLGQGHSAAYDATADRWETLYVGTPWDEPRACGSRPECRMMPTLVYDPANERLVVYGGSVYASAEMGMVYPDDVLAFDLETREWTVLLEASTAQPAPSSE
jgi:hypothetical protein